MVGGAWRVAGFCMANEGNVFGHPSFLGRLLQRISIWRACMLVRHRWQPGLQVEQCLFMAVLIALDGEQVRYRLIYGLW